MTTILDGSIASTKWLSFRNALQIKPTADYAVGFVLPIG
jgi:hypothetical protein